MNKITTALGIVGLTMGVAFSGFANPCSPIAEACMKAGYYRGGNTVGKGLVENCVLPVVTKKKTLGNYSFDEGMLQQCKALVMQKLKTQQGNH